MGFFGELFGGDRSWLTGELSEEKKKEQNSLQVAADPYGKLRKTYLDWLEPEIGQPGKKYPGQMVAPMSPQEGQSFDFLRQYGEGGMSPTFKQGQAEIGKTLGGQYDPSTSPYYQAVKAEAGKNLAETQKGIAGEAAGGGRYWTGARLKSQQEAASESERGLNTLMGELANRERDRMTSVIPQALQYCQAEQNLPLEQAMAFQSLGALPRSIEQAGLGAEQQDWLRSEYDYPMQIAGLAAGTQQPPVYQQQPPSAISQLMGGVGQGAGDIGMMMLMQKLFSGGVA